MFCPVCKAEYRFGFTHCSDCDVDLVESLDSSADSDAGQSGQLEAAGLDTPELLWTGIDSGAFTRIRAALDEANIPNGNEPVEARLLYASLRNLSRSGFGEPTVTAREKSSPTSSGPSPLRTSLR
jgi:hypothetical protein